MARRYTINHAIIRNLHAWNINIILVSFQTEINGATFVSKKLPKCCCSRNFLGTLQTPHDLPQLDLSWIDLPCLDLTWPDLFHLTCLDLTCPDLTGTFLIPNRQPPDTLQTPSRHHPDTIHAPSRHLSDTFQTPSRHMGPFSPVEIRWRLD